MTAPPTDRRPPRVEPAIGSGFARTDVLAVLADSPAVHALAPDQLDELARCASIVTCFEADDVVVRQGDAAEHLFLVLEGEVIVRRHQGGEAFELARLGPGEMFGEAAVLGGGPRNATVVTAGPGRLLRLPAEVVRDIDHRPWAVEALRDVGRAMSQRVRHTNTVAVEALRREAEESRRRLAMGHFIMWIVVGMSLYTISLGATLSVTDDLALASMCTNAVILLSVFAMWRLVSQSPYGRATFGLVINPGWRREIGEALLWSLGLIALATGAKWILIATVPALSDVPLLDSPYLGARPLGTVDVVFTVTYFVLSPVQEMIARGCLQSSLTVFLEKRPLHVAQAILLSNLIFAANHAHLSPWFTALAFAPGLAWGVLYHRQRSLLGVAISHAIVGTWALKVLGLDLLARM